MTSTYDPRYNIAYIRFQKKDSSNSKVDSIKISDELIVDISTDGKIFGIELLMQLNN